MDLTRQKGKRKHPKDLKRKKEIENWTKRKKEKQRKKGVMGPQLIIINVKIQNRNVM